MNDCFEGLLQGRLLRELDRGVVQEAQAGNELEELLVLAEGGVQGIEELRHLGGVHDLDVLLEPVVGIGEDGIQGVDVGDLLVALLDLEQGFD